MLTDILAPQAGKAKEMETGMVGWALWTTTIMHKAGLPVSLCELQKMKGHTCCQQVAKKRKNEEFHRVVVKDRESIELFQTSITIYRFLNFNLTKTPWATNEEIIDVAIPVVTTGLVDCSMKN
jgi:hypothetical protein